MDIKVEIKNIEPGQVSTVLREVKQELFAPVTPTPVEQLLQAYLQHQVDLQTVQATPMRSAADEVAFPPTLPSRFHPTQVFGEAGTRRIAPAPPPVTPATVLTTEGQSSQGSCQEATTDGLATPKADPFNNNWLFGLVIAAIVLGGWCMSAKQNPVSFAQVLSPQSVPVRAS